MVVIVREPPKKESRTNSGLDIILICPELPILGEIKQYKCKVILRDFPYNGALFGLVI